MVMGCEWILLEHLTHHTGSISSSETLEYRNEQVMAVDFQKANIDTCYN